MADQFPVIMDRWLGPERSPFLVAPCLAVLDRSQSFTIVHDRSRSIPPGGDPGDGPRITFLNKGNEPHSQFEGLR